MFNLIYYKKSHQNNCERESLQDVQILSKRCFNWLSPAIQKNKINFVLMYALRKDNHLHLIFF